MSNIKAYRYEFKKTDLMIVRDGRPTKVGELDYAQTYRDIVTLATKQDGITPDEVIRAVEALDPLKDAKAKNLEYIILDKDGYDYLKRCLMQFKFAIAAEAVVEYITYVRSLPIVDLQPTTAEPSR